MRESVAGVSISHPERVLYPELGVTKVELARYYAAIGARMLPHVQGRPLTLVRCPTGLNAPCLYMRHAKVWGPPALRRVNIPEKTKIGEYLVICDVAGIVSLVQMDVLEIHTQNVTAESLERPDRIVFDLDPGPLVAWRRVVDAAHDLRERLARMSLKCWVKTTGGSGLHVLLPIVPELGWDPCVAFARGIAAEMAKDDPAHYSISMPKAGRQNKIFIDYLRNNRANTSVAAYSTRARHGAPVSMPISWDELDRLPRSDAFTIVDVLRRLGSRRRDPWAGYFRARQSLRAVR